MFFYKNKFTFPSGGIHSFFNRQKIAFQHYLTFGVVRGGTE